MKNKIVKLSIASLLVVILAVGITIAALAVSGAAFTTFNAAADGSGKDVCKNSAINCNIYGAKEYVWLNGGPTANGLGPDGDYFFAVLVPGGQPNPNDGSPKNLSDDFDAYTNRSFTVTGGEVSAYAGTHDMDSGEPGNPKVDGNPPYIRLFPYADTTNPGGVYIMAICSLEDGYPVDPRDCKYDAFKVKKGRLPYQFMLSGMKFEDIYADGIKDATDPGLAGWTITIKGTGPDDQPIDTSVVTGPGGYWEWLAPEYWFTSSNAPQQINLEICEVLQTDWHQSYPTPLCYTLNFTPVVPGFESFYDLDFGNWQPVDVTACKERDLDGVEGGETVPVPGWMVSLTREGVVVDTQPTGADGCYTWTDLTPGFSYDVHEASMPGWEALSETDWVFERAVSDGSYSYTFVNAVLQGCTPGFWQGGSAGGQAGGRWLWDTNGLFTDIISDPDWVASGGMGANPYNHMDNFQGYFGGSGSNTMWYYVNPDLWSSNTDFEKAARSLTAAYLNVSWGMNYPYTTTELQDMWDAAVASGDFLSLHTMLDAANNAYADTNGDGILEHQCPISAGGY
jgi:hypothetical protein